MFAIASRLRGPHIIDDDVRAPSPHHAFERAGTARARRPPLQVGAHAQQGEAPLPRVKPQNAMQSLSVIMSLA